jgi:Domain of unknown function (DUF4412)
MKRTFLLLAVFSIVVAARADLVVQERIESSPENFVRTIKVKGDKIRVDTASDRRGNTSMIKDESTGEITGLIHTNKTAGKMKQEPANPAYADILTSAAPLDTGASEKVGGYDAEIYAWSAGTNGTEVEKLWVAKDFPDYDKMKADLTVLDKVNDFGNTKSVQPRVAGLPGMVVKSFKTRESHGATQTATVTLISAKVEPLDDSIFEVPADYKPIKPATAPDHQAMMITNKLN